MPFEIFILISWHFEYGTSWEDSSQTATTSINLTTNYTSFSNNRLYSTTKIYFTGTGVHGYAYGPPPCGAAYIWITSNDTKIHLHFYYFTSQQQYNILNHTYNNNFTNMLKPSNITIYSTSKSNYVQ